MAALLAALALTSNAGANDSSLRARLDSWSRKVGADARSVSLAAKRRDPRLLTSRAARFRSDAHRARAAIAAQRPSTAAGQRAKRLALAALANYGAAGSRWVRSGRALLSGQKAAASRYARAATASARAGNRLLLTAIRLLR